MLSVAPNRPAPCRYDREGEPSFASARLWDDGVIRPQVSRIGVCCAAITACNCIAGGVVLTRGCISSKHAACFRVAACLHCRRAHLPAFVRPLMRAGHAHGAGAEPGGRTQPASGGQPLWCLPHVRCLRFQLAAQLSRPRSQAAALESSACEMPLRNRFVLPAAGCHNMYIKRRSAAAAPALPVVAASSLKHPTPNLCSDLLQFFSHCTV